jgi:D-cysteine desulfhydrase family pyridoxal phosphate-dependent enzyme
MMQMADRTLPRLLFAHLPTPVEPMPRLSTALGGPQLWIKRDDQTGLAFGGNKTRKLEFLLAEAQSHGAHTLVTTGAVQSNHCRQTAAAAARHGLDCILVLGGYQPERSTGNVLLDELFGAEIVWAEDQDPPQILQKIFDSAWEAGRRPYLVPYGGSNAIGAAAYAEALREFMEQDVPVDRIVFASSSGGTQAGLVAGAQIHGFRGRIQGISVDSRSAPLCEFIAGLANEIGSLLGHSLSLTGSDIEVDDGYLGGGYAVVGDLERNAIDIFARHEGILLDPVYTGRAAGGLMDWIEKGMIKAEERVLFWHTGGTPSLFAFADQLR